MNLTSKDKVYVVSVCLHRLTALHITHKHEITMGSMLYLHFPNATTDELHLKHSSVGTLGIILPQCKHYDCEINDNVPS